MSYDKVAWRNQKEAARVVEEARKSGDPERVETCTRGLLAGGGC